MEWWQPMKVQLIESGWQHILQDEKHWPVHHLLEISEDDWNVKPVKAKTYIVKHDLEADALIHHYSLWFALKKVVAWVNHFQTYLRY